MKTWTTEMWLQGMPREVLARLTDPAAIARWSPVPFELMDLDRGRLEPGAHARVEGSLMGRSVIFDVEILEADDESFSLIATGPIVIDASYALRPADGGSRVKAAVQVHGRGLLGGLLARATEAILAAGALRTSLGQLARELERGTTPAHT